MEKDVKISIKKPSRNNGVDSGLIATRPAPDNNVRQLIFSRRHRVRTRNSAGCSDEPRVRPSNLRFRLTGRKVYASTKKKAHRPYTCAGRNSICANKANNEGKQATVKSVAGSRLVCSKCTPYRCRQRSQGKVLALERRRRSVLEEAVQEEEVNCCDVACLST